MWDRDGIVIVILHQIWYRDSDFLVISPWFSRDFSVIFQWFMKWETSGRVRDVIFHQFFSYNRDFTVIPSLREVKPCFKKSQFQNSREKNKLDMYLVDLV